MPISCLFLVLHYLITDFILLSDACPLHKLKGMLFSLPSPCLSSISSKL